MTSFIAEDPVHVVVRNELPALVDAGGRGIVRPAQRRLYAKFTRGVAPDFAREIGLATFGFKKMPEGVEAIQWLAFYDTLEAQDTFGWTDEERQAIEAKLETIDGVIKVERPRLTAPWPAYDTIVAKRGEFSSAQVVAKIAGKVEEDGYDAGDVIAYELENRKRKSVINALEELAGAPVAQIEELEEEELIEA